MVTLVAIGMLSAAYLLHLVSPLRLYSDGVTYLRMAEVAAAGNALAGWPFPPGYPLVLALFHRLGFLNSVMIVALNCAFIAIGSWASYRIVRGAFGLSQLAALLVCLATLLAWNFVKHVALPSSDIPFFAASSLALLALMRAEQPDASHWKYLALASALAIAAILIRSIGIALVPALAWAAVRPLLLSDTARGIRRGSQRTRLLSVVAAITVVLGASAFLLVPSGYAGVLGRLYGAYFDSAIAGVLRLAGDRLSGVGEVASNVPLSLVPQDARIGWAIAGIVAIAGIGAGMWRRRRWDAFEVFGLSYLAIFLACPCSDRGRYLLPVIPLLAAWLALGVTPWMGRSSVVSWGVVAYGAAFMLAGLAALAYSLSLSLSHSYFLARYGDGAMRPTYRVAFGTPAAGDSLRTDPEALRLLKAYSRFGVARPTSGR